MTQLSIEKLTWSEACPTISAINPDFAHEIDKINPDASYPLYRAKYRYGQLILKNGVFFLPSQSGDTIPIDSADIPKSIYADLHYNLSSNPFSLLLNKTAELFFTLGRRVVPFHLIRPGQLLGAWGILDNTPSFHPVSIWQMSAGARSVFMLPRISEKNAHAKLQHAYALSSPAPRDHFDHGAVFADIAQKRFDESSWEMEIIFFGKKWFDNLSQPHWLSFKNYLLESSWKNSSYLRNHIFMNLLFSSLNEKIKLPQNAYINDIIKHLFSMAVGSGLGFIPATKEEALPLTLIQDTYADGIYKLKSYFPTILQPSYYNKNDPLGIYYSQAVSAALEYSTRSSRKPSLLSDLYLIQTTMSQYIEHILADQSGVTTKAFQEAARSVNFDCYHLHPEDYRYIQPNSNLLQTDLRFGQERAIALNSPLLRGCIRLSQKS